jgi:hypothetical protein
MQVDLWLILYFWGPVELGREDNSTGHFLRAEN